MKTKIHLTAISAAFVCCAGISGFTMGSEANGSAGSPIIYSDTWQQMVAKFGEVDVDSLFSGAGDWGAVPEAAEYGPGTNYTTIPASAFDNSVHLGPGDRVTVLPLATWLGNPTPPGTPDVFDFAPGGILFSGPGTNPVYDAPAYLDAGVRVTGLEFYGWDVDPIANEVIQAGLINICNTTPGVPVPPPDPQWGTLSKLSVTPATGAAPGIVRLNGSAVDHTVDNEHCAYSVVVRIGNANLLGTGALKVRIAWQRQITPAPATATFSDVSTTHPFYREIEAMVSSGITGGCGGGMYCPDATLTRAQMAAFLARGLGL